MGKYLDLSLLVDVEPETSEVLSLVEDEDLQFEFWSRLGREFFEDFVKAYCKQPDIEIMKEILDEMCEEPSED